MTEPTNDAEIVAGRARYNRIAKALAEALPGWWVESESDSVARAYSDDPREAAREDVVGIQIRTDHEAPFTASSTLWNERRGMHDLGESTECETLEAAVDAAAEMAEGHGPDGTMSREADAVDMDPRTAPREEVGWAVVAIHTDAGTGPDEAPIPIAVFPDAEWNEVGDLVADRIEASSGEAWSAVERPEPGESRRFGLVAWAEDGKPTRLYTEDHLVVYDERGIGESYPVDDLYPDN